MRRGRGCVWGSTNTNYCCRVGGNGSTLSISPVNSGLSCFKTCLYKHSDDQILSGGSVREAPQDGPGGERHLPRAASRSALLFIRSRGSIDYGGLEVDRARGAPGPRKGEINQATKSDKGGKETHEGSGFSLRPLFTTAAPHEAETNREAAFTCKACQSP